jgi:hypothetical protein
MSEYGLGSPSLDLPKETSIDELTSSETDDDNAWECLDLEKGGFADRIKE